MFLQGESVLFREMIRRVTLMEKQGLVLYSIPDNIPIGERELGVNIFRHFLNSVASVLKNVNV